MKEELYKALEERSDSHLLAHVFEAADPENELFLLAEAPEDISGAIVASWYWQKEPLPKVRCRQCRKSHWKANHRQGFVIRLPDGSGLLIGKSCGRDHYGANWTVIMKHFRGRQSRKHYLERRSYLLETWPKINQEILTVKKTGWLHSYDLARQSLERRLPKCHEALLVDQVERFRIGDKDRKREDDLLDTFCYGVALALGNNKGF